jgi:hypothetical protein
LAARSSIKKAAVAEAGAVEVMDCAKKFDSAKFSPLRDGDVFTYSGSFGEYRVYAGKA